MDFQTAEEHFYNSIKSKNIPGITYSLKLLAGFNEFKFHLSNKNLQARGIDLSHDQVTISNSQINSNVKIFELKIESLLFKAIHFSERVEISESIFQNLTFENCTFAKGISVSNTTSKSIELQSCNCQDQELIFQEIKKADSIQISGIHAPLSKLKLELSCPKAFRITNTQRISVLASIELNQIKTSILEFSQNLKINNISISNSEVEKVQFSNITPNDKTSVSASIIGGTYHEMSFDPSVVYDSITVEGIECQSLRVCAPSSKTLIKTINNTPDEEGALTIGSVQGKLEILDCRFFKGIKFDSTFNSKSKLILNDIQTSNVVFGEINQVSNYNFNIEVRNIHSSPKYSFFKKPIDLSLIRINMQANLYFQNIGIKDNTFKGSTFSYTIEFDRVDFHRVLHLHSNNFQTNCHINFVSCRFYDFTSFEAEESYRSLKKQASSTNYEYGEHLFTSLELYSRCKKLSWATFERWAGQIGWCINNFGESIFKPFIWLLVTFILFSLTYYASETVSVVNELDLEKYKNTWLDKLMGSEKTIYSSIYFSLTNTLVILKLSTVSDFLAPKSLLGVFFSITQTVLSSILVYMFIVGIQKRFRQK